MVACLTTWGTAWPPACVPNTGGPNLRGRWGGGGSHTRETTNGAAEHSSSQWTASCASISSSVHQFTNTQIQIHEYKCTSTNAQTLRHNELHGCVSTWPPLCATLCSPKLASNRQKCQKPMRQRHAVINNTVGFIKLVSLERGIVGQLYRPHGMADSLWQLRLRRED